MTINRDNYEAYFLDYFEGQLSPEMVEEVLMFVDQNPDLKKVLDTFEAVALVSDQDIVFEKKSSLKKDQVFTTSQVNERNYEEYLIGETEGILNADQLASIEEFISINPQFEQDRKLFALTHLTADSEIIFEAKDSLKQKAIPVGSINAETFETCMARELEGNLNPEEKLLLAEFMQFNRHLERDRNLYKKTILKADTDIIFEDKRSLKQSSTIPIRRIVYYALSAAASLALMLSVYFLLDRTDVPRRIADEGKVKNKINNTITEPATENKDNQIAATIKHPAAIVIAPDPNAGTLASAANNTTENQSNEPGAFADHTTIETLHSRAAVEITTRSYVDPQFTFIRTSQMYFNENREFYYNMKLAEEIQYAQLNSKDKNPGKTIFDATLGRVGELFASNRSEQPKQENKNISLWTFAELGVQTFNTVTSSELELKLEKDDEGNVVAYGLEGGLIDFEKEVKK